MRYQILWDSAGGKVHGSQRGGDSDPKTGLLDLLVYYKVVEGNRELVK
jgi:hypothetical protein